MMGDRDYRHLIKNAIDSISKDIEPKVEDPKEEPKEIVKEQPKVKSSKSTYLIGIPQSVRDSDGYTLLLILMTFILIALIILLLLVR